jgi:hypothetical protein
MLHRNLIAFTAAVVLGCVPVTSNALAAGHPGGHGGGGRAAGAHAMGGHAMAGHARGGYSGRRFAGGRRFGPGYGGGYGCNGYYGNYGYYNGYNGCGYNPGAAVVGGLIGGALNGVGRY